MRAASGSLDNFTDEDRWQWHAYEYGWRRVFRDDQAKRSPIDRGGDWFDEGLVLQAAAYFRKPADDAYRGRYQRERSPKVHPPSHPDAVRTACRSIPWNQLTGAEREFLGPDMDAMMANVQLNLGKVVGAPDLRHVATAAEAKPMAAAIDAELREAHAVLDRKGVAMSQSPRPAQREETPPMPPRAFTEPMGEPLPLDDDGYDQLDGIPE